MLARHIDMAHERRGVGVLAEMRKHSMWYLKGLPSAAEVRAKLNATLDFAEIQSVLREYLDWLEQHPELIAKDRDAAFAGAASVSAQVEVGV
jgi:tRNA-dihydrouridine synthase